MPIKDVLKIKIEKHTVYSLGLASVSLMSLSLLFFINELLGLLNIETKGIVLAVLLLMLISGLTLVFAVVYNGFFGNLTVPPIYKAGVLSKISIFIFKHKLYLIGLVIVSIAAFTILPKSHSISSVGLFVFSVLVFIFSFAFSVGFVQLLKNGYILKRNLAEKINELNLNMEGFSVAGAAAEDPAFKYLIKKSAKPKVKKYLNEILQKEIKEPEMSSPTVTVLLLNKINSDMNPPEDIEPAFRFWQQNSF